MRNFLFFIFLTFGEMGSFWMGKLHSQHLRVFWMHLFVFCFYTNLKYSSICLLSFLKFWSSKRTLVKKKKKKKKIFFLFSETKKGSRRTVNFAINIFTFEFFKLAVTCERRIFIFRLFNSLCSPNFSIILCNRIFNIEYFNTDIIFRCILKILIELILFVFF